MAQTLLIRADAGPRMGTGHIMRCLALAQAAQSAGMDVHMICRAGVDWVRERPAREGIPLHGLSGEPPREEDPAALLEQLTIPGEPSGAVVLDGYHFTPACQKAVRAAGYTLLVIDDYNHLPEYHCDILLNQNFGADRFAYRGTVGKKLLGLEYVLLRREFLDARQKARQRVFSGTPQKLLITLGGGDFIEFLEKIAADLVLPELAGRTLRVLQGAMDEQRIRDAFRNCPAKPEILPRVDDMPALLLDTDLCITAGGSTCWELLCLGVPFLTVAVAENQKHTGDGMREKAVAPRYSVGKFLSFLTKKQTGYDPERADVDARGAARVIREMRTLKI